MLPTDISEETHKTRPRPAIHGTKVDLSKSAVSYWLENIDGQSYYLSWHGSGWAVKFQESYLCKDGCFKHRNDIKSFEFSYHPGGDWEHVFETKEKAIYAFQKSNGRLPLPKLEDILRGKKTLISYYSYPTGTEGEHIANESATEFNKEIKDHPLNTTVVNAVDRVINEACARLGFRRDNKECVKVMIEGIEQPIYFVTYDLERIICTKIRFRGGTEYSLINIEKK